MVNVLAEKITTEIIPHCSKEIISCAEVDPNLRRPCYWFPMRDTTRPWLIEQIATSPVRVYTSFRYMLFRWTICFGKAELWFTLYVPKVDMDMSRIIGDVLNRSTLQNWLGRTGTRRGDVLRSRWRRGTAEAKAEVGCFSPIEAEYSQPRQDR